MEGKNKFNSFFSVSQCLCVIISFFIGFRGWGLVKTTNKNLCALCVFVFFSVSSVVKLKFRIPRLLLIPLIVALF